MASLSCGSISDKVAGEGRTTSAQHLPLLFLKSVSIAHGIACVAQQGLLPVFSAKLLLPG
jgi:hypothetical protein